MTFDDDASATPVVTIPALTAGTELIFTLTVTGRGGANTSYGTDTDTDTATVTSAEPTLVSNTDQTLESVGSIHFHAQSFETGANPDGYTVSEVDVHLAIVSGRSTSVNIRENDGSDEPGDLVATLTNPDTLTPDSLNTFTAPAGTTLAATTTYWISVNEGITSVSNRATFGRVEGNDETGEPGWSIGDGRLWRDAETSGWTSSDHSLMIEIRGTAVFCDGIWCATLTVRDLGSDDRGCGNSSTGNECTVHLSDYEFTHAMTDYSVGGVRVKSNGQLQMFMGADIATDSESLVLHVGSETFAFEDADTKEARNRKWDSSGLIWTTGDTIQLKLTGGVTNTAAEGQPDISGAAQVDKTLTAEQGDIDDDGRFADRHLPFRLHLRVGERGHLECGGDCRRQEQHLHGVVHGHGEHDQGGGELHRRRGQFRDGHQRRGGAGSGGGPRQLSRGQRLGSDADDGVQFRRELRFERSNLRL